MSITTDMFNHSYNLDLNTKRDLFASRCFRFIHWCDDWYNKVLYSKKGMGALGQLIVSSGQKCLDVHESDAPSVKMG